LITQGALLDKVTFAIFHLYNDGAIRTSRLGGVCTTANGNGMGQKNCSTVIRISSALINKKQVLVTTVTTQYINLWLMILSHSIGPLN
jgi:hypothetical protein